ncbi:hypothetical protein ACH4Q6_22285 [Streptomyces lydicus]|uniref:hypothetical protein n=1 Tax=Streptomyces lydicus TaxID=47763 RepID=UPI0037AA0E10
MISRPHHRRHGGSRPARVTGNSVLTVQLPAFRMTSSQSLPHTVVVREPPKRNAVTVTVAPY